MTEKVSVEVVGCVINDRAQLFIRNRGANERFLGSVDPLFWNYQATAHAAVLKDESKEVKQRAAVALRLTFSQGVETLFALIGAFIQCPEFPLGWLSNYRNADLREVVRKIHKSEPLDSALRNTPSWNEVARVVFHFAPQAMRAPAIEGFGDLWQRLAEQFLDEFFEPEYNSLKHGMRSSVGGFSLSMSSAEKSANNPEPQMLSVGSADYGSSFWMPPLKVDGTRRTFELQKHVTRAWIPEQFVSALPLIGMSIANVVRRAQIASGAEPTEAEWACTDEETFRTPWTRYSSIENMSMGHKTRLPGWSEPSEQVVKAALNGPAADGQ